MRIVICVNKHAVAAGHTSRRTSPQEEKQKRSGYDSKDALYATMVS